ncbi:uncharacterized protein LOC117176010 isoform X1 [Belonocnema kinseyi]|uniref:uncharacterized protein LOC117176010 isoform X1 n=1 Tax=Belonocnema kinseyi TaxID=2817044 RepID=UPI00143DA011|nr:uncharacterized protein LOC117176010 isoform X1 [Belonocnema kinseyi]
MCEACRKCNKWVKLCGRKDSKFKSIRNVTKDTYICSLHFFGDSGSTEEYPDPIECRPKTIKEKTQKSRRSLEQKYQRFSLKSEESTSTIGSSCFTGKEKSRETNSTDVEFEEVKAFRDPEPNFSTEMQSMDMESKSNDRGQAFSSTETQTNFETLHELEGMESTTDGKIIISVSVGAQTDFEDFDESKVVESQSTMKVSKVRSTGIKTSKRFEDSLRNDNDKCIFYTGLHFKYITVIMSFIGDVANSLNYWGSSRKSNFSTRLRPKMFASRRQVAKYLPKIFRNFKNLRVILDCTEFFCEAPANFEHQGNLYSQYKGPYDI